MLCSLLDILFAYAFDHRTTLGEPTVESAWTVSKLSITLSWLDTPTSVKDAIINCLHRALTYPVFRNWNLACRVVQDVHTLLKLGRRAILRALLTVRRILQRDECRQYLNTLYIEPYAVWIQGVDEATLTAVAHEMELYKPDKNDIRWDLAEIESVAQSDGFRPEEDAECAKVLL